MIVDDHPVLRKGLRATIDEQRDLVVCGEAEDVSEALAAVESLRPKLILLDLNLKGVLCLELIKELKGRYPELLIMVISLHDDVLMAERALQAGAQGYINKQAAIVSLVKAVRLVLNGGFYLSEAIKSRLAQQCAHRGKLSLVAPMDLLSDRELEVFHLIGHGRGVRQIAATLHLDVNTVKTYRTRIKEKLNLSSATEVLQHAVQWRESGGLPEAQKKAHWFSPADKPGE